MENIKLLKIFAKRAGITTRQARVVWDNNVNRLVAEGHAQSDRLFIQDVVIAVRKELNVHENTATLEKFKKYL